MIARLDQFISAERVGEYYETVFADMVADGMLEFDAVFFDENNWYEIDTIKDLRQAELMFASIPSLAEVSRHALSLATVQQNIGVIINKTGLEKAI